MRTDDTISKRFPDRGPKPSDEVVVDPDADPAPNTDHPGAEDE